MLFIRLVATMTDETFAELVAASPRKIREALFQRLGIKAKKTIGLKLHAKLEDRTKKLHDKLRAATSESEDRLCEELVRNWLYTKRSMLKAALDFLGVRNDHGLVDEEPSFFQELPKDKVAALIAHLEAGGFTREHIALYLHFVRVPNVDELIQSPHAA